MLTTAFRRAAPSLLIGQHLRRRSISITQSCAKVCASPPLQPLPLTPLPFLDTADHKPECEERRGSARADAALISRARRLLRLQLQVRDDGQKRCGRGRRHVRENPRCRRCPAGSRPRTVRVAWRSVFEEAGAKVVVDEGSLALVKGATIDFEDDMLRSAPLVCHKKAAPLQRTPLQLRHRRPWPSPLEALRSTRPAGAHPRRRS